MEILFITQYKFHSLYWYIRWTLKRKRENNYHNNKEVIFIYSNSPMFPLEIVIINFNEWTQGVWISSNVLFLTSLIRSFTSIFRELSLIRPEEPKWHFYTLMVTRTFIACCIFQNCLFKSYVISFNIWKHEGFVISGCVKLILYYSNFSS